MLLCRTDLPRGLDWPPQPFHGYMPRLNVVLTGHKLITYVHVVGSNGMGKEKFKYDGNKLPRVVPTRTSKQPPQYNAKHETLDKPHDLGFMVVDKKNWYYELATSSVWLWDESSPDKFVWASCESILKIMLGVCVQSGLSWFKVNTLLIPIHLVDLKYWALVKLDLTSWTIEVYDSLQHEGPHNSKVREGVECI
ncbi:hypothetical protein TIFTF001_046310 [Ficus carica]|uniref:Ubiquitin-like protease family profile domain-containing protein n=1 Tax=Ficus carica TaxID=3494 RepID=A0AA88CT56_FICCA|nr:hypothetical protein TIFTF001_046310 [Ficus carica]